MHELGTELANLKVQPNLIERIKVARDSDPELQKIRREVDYDKQPKFQVDGDGSLKFKNRLCIPNTPYLNKKIL